MGDFATVTSASPWRDTTTASSGTASAEVLPPMSNAAVASPLKPMSGTRWTYVPSGLPGARPRRLNCATR